MNIIQDNYKETLIMKESSNDKGCKICCVYILIHLGFLSLQFLFMQFFRNQEMLKFMNILDIFSFWTFYRWLPEHTAPQILMCHFLEPLKVIHNLLKILFPYVFCSFCLPPWHYAGDIQNINSFTLYCMWLKKSRAEQ